MSIGFGDMCGETGGFFASGNPICPEQKTFLADSPTEIVRDFRRIWRGWQWRGSLLPRPQKRHSPLPGRMPCIRGSTLLTDFSVALSRSNARETPVIGGWYPALACGGGFQPTTPALFRAISQDVFPVS